ncbi:MAG: replication-relaxation family protein [Limisphaerales bacterium]
MLGSRQQLLRRLQLLFQHGYLERPRAQLDWYHKGGSREIVYGIGDKGAALLKRENGANAKELRWSEKNRKTERMFLEHALLVSDIMVALELACREKNIRLLTQQDLQVRGKEKLFEWRVNINPQVRLTTTPDRVFALEYLNPSGNAECAYFFLEADRGTMPVIRSGFSQTSFFRKLLAYEATWLQRIHEKRYSFHRFRVLTVTTGAPRVKSLVEACARLKQGHGLFLFADRSILEKPGEFLSHTWQSGRASETSTLLN